MYNFISDIDTKFLHETTTAQELVVPAECLQLLQPFRVKSEHARIESVNDNLHIPAGYDLSWWHSRYDSVTLYVSKLIWQKDFETAHFNCKLKYFIHKIQPSLATPLYFSHASLKDDTQLAHFLKWEQKHSIWRQIDDAVKAHRKILPAT